MGVPEQEDGRCGRDLLQRDLDIFQKVNEPVAVTPSSTRVPVTPKVECMDMTASFGEVMREVSISTAVLSIAVYDKDVGARCILVFWKPLLKE